MANDTVKPAAILVSICATTGLLLGVINNLTQPVIVENREARARATYAALVPSASEFVAQPCDISGVTAYMDARENQGHVVVAQAKGYSGQVPVAVAFSPDGTITSLAALDNDETPGLGTKIADATFTGQFIGRSAQPINLEDIDTITGATISSKAALGALNRAIEAFNASSGTGGAASGTGGAAPANADAPGKADTKGAH